MKVAFYTLGCKVNQYETNGMIQEFKNKGYALRCRRGFESFKGKY